MTLSTSVFFAAGTLFFGNFESFYRISKFCSENDICVNSLFLSRFSEYKLYNYMLGWIFHRPLMGSVLER